MSASSQLLRDLRLQAPELIWTPRIRFGGLLDIPDDRGQTQGAGADRPVSGSTCSRAKPWTGESSTSKARSSAAVFPAPRGEILVSDELARHLDVEPGATATLISSTMYGGMATSNFTIAGTIRLGIRAMDRGTMLADVSGRAGGAGHGGCGRRDSWILSRHALPQAGRRRHRRAVQRPMGRRSTTSSRPPWCP